MTGGEVEILSRAHALFAGAPAALALESATATSAGPPPSQAGVAAVAYRDAAALWRTELAVSRSEDAELARIITAAGRDHRFAHHATAAVQPLCGGRNSQFPGRRMLNLHASSPPPAVITDLRTSPPPQCWQPLARTPRQYRLIRLRPESCCAAELSVCAPSSATYSPREDAHDGAGPRCWPCDTGAAPVAFRADYRAAVPPPTLPCGQH